MQWSDLDQSVVLIHQVYRMLSSGHKLNYEAKQAIGTDVPRGRAWYSVKGQMELQKQTKELYELVVPMAVQGRTAG
jgi:hypothetical protein